MLCNDVSFQCFSSEGCALALDTPRVYEGTTMLRIRRGRALYVQAEKVMIERQPDCRCVKVRLKRDRIYAEMRVGTAVF